MELGKYIVAELGLEPSVDTLGRWMAHHVAGLIDKVEKSDEPKEKAAAENEACELIIKLWEHRNEIPANVDPIKKYNNCLDFLSAIIPVDQENNYTRIFRPFPKDDGISKHACSLVHKYNKSIFALILMKIDESTPNDEVAVKNASDEEVKIINLIENYKDQILNGEETLNNLALENLKAMQRDVKALIKVLEGDPDGDENYDEDILIDL